MSHRLLIACALLVGGCAGGLPTGAALQPSGLDAQQALQRNVVALLRQDNPVIAGRDGGAGFEAKLAALTESPWRFFRGAAGLFYRDAARTFPDADSIPLMGDLHLENMSAMPMGEGVGYELDDFDDSFTGPARWEVARGATSVILGARALGFAEAPALTAYFEGYADGLKSKPKALAHPVDRDDLSEPAQDALKKAAKAEHAKWIAKYAERGRLLETEKLKPLPSPERERLMAAARQAGAWRYGEILDVASRLAGTASIGRRRFVFLTAGPGPAASDDGLVEWKEAQAPVVAGFGWRVSRALTPGARVAGAVRYFSPLLPEMPVAVADGTVSYVQRPLGPRQADVALTDLKSAKALARHAGTLGLLAGRAHARSGQAERLKLDATRRQAIAAFAERASAQVASDHAALVAARSAR